MKVLVIGDIHGHDGWKTIVDNALLKFYHIVFVGDYVDSFTVKLVEILHNLKEIVDIKKIYPDRITLLLGNHEYAYIDNHHRTSGYKWHMVADYKKIFKENYDLFQVAWGYRNFMTNKYTLITHAGLTNNYYNKYLKPLIENKDSKLNMFAKGKADKLELHEVLNYLRDDEILWKIGRMRGGIGTPSPLWADYLELLDDRYEGINQVFGHTAAGTLSMDQFGDDLVVKVDGNQNKTTLSILLNL